MPAGQLAGHSEKPGIVVSKLIGDIVIILVIILIGGFFAGAEMALVSLREGQIRKLSRRGKRGRGPRSWPRIRTGSCRRCRSG